VPILSVQTERSVDMLLHGKKPLVEVTLYLACLYQFCGRRNSGCFWMYKQIML
jgi:hypothetical protein